MVVKTQEKQPSICKIVFRFTLPFICLIRHVTGSKSEAHSFTRLSELFLFSAQQPPPQQPPTFRGSSAALAERRVVSVMVSSGVEEGHAVESQHGDVGGAVRCHCSRLWLESGGRVRGE